MTANESLDLALAEISEVIPLVGSQGLIVKQIFASRFQWLVDENKELQRRVEQSNQTIEDVCVGARIECTRCGKPRPCCCSDIS